MNASAFMQPAAKELSEICKQVLQIPDEGVVLRSSKMARVDWRALIGNTEVGKQGLKTPFCVISFGQGVPPQDWGMATKGYELSFAVYYVISMKDRIRTSVTDIDVDEGTVVLDKTPFLGQTFWNETKEELTMVVADSAVPGWWKLDPLPALGNRLVSDPVLDAEARIERLREALLPGMPYNDFQIVKDTSIDSSEANPANTVFVADNYPLFAVELTGSLLVGELY